MGEPLEKKQYYTIQEYLELEEYSEVRHEYYRGEVLAMAGTTKSHNYCVQNIAFAFRQHFDPLGCATFSESVKLELKKDEWFTYPDVMVSCSETDKNDPLYVREPVIIVEVLSKGTARIDERDKLFQYLQISTLQVYLLVSRREYSVIVYERKNANWTVQVVEDIARSIYLESLNVELPLANVYRGVALET